MELVTSAKSNKIRGIIENSAEISVYSDRHYTNSWRRTSLVDKKYVFKEFSYKDKVRNYIWNVEADIIDYLHKVKEYKLPLPDNVDLEIRKSKNRVKAFYVKSFIDGKINKKYEERHIAELANTLFHLHQLDVLVLDVGSENFVEIDRKLCPFDFGMGKILKYNSLSFKKSRGEEFFRLSHVTDEAKFNAFIKEYSRLSGVSVFELMFFYKLHDFKQGFRSLRKKLFK
jgi:tRNA A-37 threonylcarbamoyl transferase component Bud32